MSEREIGVARQLALVSPNTVDDVVLGTHRRFSAVLPTYTVHVVAPTHGLRPMTCLARSGLRFDARDCVDQVMENLRQAAGS